MDEDSGGIGSGSGVGSMTLAGAWSYQILLTDRSRTPDAAQDSASRKV